MKLGARIVKTGVAIVLALFIAELLATSESSICRNRSHFCDSTFHLSIIFNDY